MKKTLLLLSFLAFAGFKGNAQVQPRWMQQPSVSPDGKWIAFEYKGNIFKVPYTGGDAVPLTIANSYNGYPVWSHDSKKIAFASDRYGNFDVYLMSASGGETSRLTFSSSRDIPYDFSVDNAKVIFGTDRHDIYSSARFPIDAIFTKLYEVPAKGGSSRLVSSAGMEYAHYNEPGDVLIFQDRKGYEDAWRKHHTSSITRDIWTYNIKNGTYTKVSSFKGEDREPVWGKGDTFYYLSEKNGTQNLFKSSLSNTAEITQLTSFEKNPVRNLSRAENGDFVFTNNGDIYTFAEGSQPKKLSINLTADFAGDQIATLPVRGEASEMAVSDDGKQVAFVFRGDIYVTSVDGSTTKRITNTPYQERMVQFSPDGKKLLYSAEHAGSWDIDQVTIVNKNEPYFYIATVLNTESIIAGPKDEFQGIYSPDGKKIAYLEERNVLKSYDLATKTTHTLVPEGINFSYSDGDQYFTWSPDGKYVLAQSTEGTISQSEVVLIKDDGSGSRVNLTESGFDDQLPQWGLDGKMMYWLSNKDGMRNLSHGSQADIYAMFFDQKAWDKFQLSKEDLDLSAETEKKDTTAMAKKPLDPKAVKKTEPAKKPAEPLVLNLKNLDNRTKRLTTASTDINGVRLSKDGEKLYYLAKYDKGYDLWVTMTRTNESKVLAKLDAQGGDLDMSKDGKSLFVLANGNIMKVGVDDGKVSPVKINSTMELDAAAERAYILEHAWKEVKKKFFDPKLQGVDWDGYYAIYKQFLPYITNDYDFQVLLSEFLGELNASHTGGRFSPSFPNGDETAALGLTYDLTRSGDGLLVKEVLESGPFDNARTKMKSDAIIDKIDGIAITQDADWAKLLNHKAGQFTRISFHDQKGGTAYEEIIKPIRQGTETNVLLYHRWVKLMEHLTDSLSGGKVGYVHVRSMDDPSFRVTFDKVLGKNRNKEALIVDSRFNGGGNLHDALSTFLSGKEYMQFRPQKHATTDGESYDRWNKPSCVLMSECNYSDAFIFPFVYKEQGIGKLIGMPVAGTGTAVWWERQINNRIVFGIPMWASYGTGDTHATENYQLEPDIMVLNDYNKILKGEDQQLEAAVKEMLKTIKK
ncbi:S41 family peptidase [Pedobacter sp. L105]|uniref:S41 family peptidase n=1 Tax=Pedobacter sp. L105 TaxID=1641871 RepID=UPI00131C5373|nr:S41 family peptidase [Pedobacter sp. L105]